MAGVSGDYPITGPCLGAGFLVTDSDGPATVCRTGDCDWYADNAVAVKGES